MSRYVGNNDECPACAARYGDFRTGLAWRDVWILFWNAPGTPSSEWRRKSRGVILGRWFEIKQDLWKRHVDECVEQRRHESERRKGRRHGKRKRVEGVCRGF